jgi:hypothetical protein
LWRGGALKQCHTTGKLPNRFGNPHELNKGVPISIHTFRNVNVYNVTLVYGRVCEPMDGPQKYGVIRIMGMGMETCENRTMGS